MLNELYDTVISELRRAMQEQHDNYGDRIDQDPTSQEALAAIDNAMSALMQIKACMRKGHMWYPPEEEEDNE